MGTVKSNHYIALIGDYAFFTALEKSLFFHKFECVKGPCIFESSEEDPAEPTCADASDYIKIIKLYIMLYILFPDGLDL